jgi:hypothetical protein
MDDPIRVALVGDFPGELVGDAQAPLRLSPERHPAIRDDPSAIEGRRHLLAADCWQLERQQGIFRRRLR